MGVPGNANPLLLVQAAGAGGYQVERSLRFNSSDSAFCARTPSSAGNRKTFTFAAWIKRSALGGEDKIFTAGSGGNITYLSFGDNVTDGLTFARYTGTHTFRLSTTQVFRDPSAWYHVILAVDTTQATDTNRVKIYVNGTQVTAFTTASYPAQNLDLEINNTNDHRIGDGTGSYSGAGQFDGYLADVIFIDGQQLTPSSLVEVSATTGQLIPKAYTGSFGTNGFWLKFSDNSAATATTLGKDYSPNGNNWTPNNLSVTQGTGNWSTQITSSSGFNSSFPPLNGFDADTNSYCQAVSDGSTLTFSPSPGIAYTSSIKILMPAAGATASVNGGTAVSVTNSVETTIASGSGTLTSLVLTATNKPGIQYIKIDDNLLLDYRAVASGVDSLVDTPSSAGTDTGLGGQVTGNYATWNPLYKYSVNPTSISNGNLDIEDTGNSGAAVRATIGMPSGKWYAEFTVNSTGGNNNAIGFGVTRETDNIVGVFRAMYSGANAFDFAGSSIYSGGSLSSGDTFMCAVDVDAGKVWLGKNGTWINSGSPATGANASCTFTPNQTVYWAASFNNTTGTKNGVLNAGARPFAYTAPSGFKALCDTNLPAPVVAKPSTVMDVKLYTGNGSTQTIGGLGFSPDFVWIKRRDSAAQHVLYDQIRGAGANKELVSSGTFEEGNTSSVATQEYGYMSAFTSDGFSVAAGTINGTYTNLNASTYVAWAFDAGTTTTTNTQGSITSQVRANASAGFSIVSWTGDGTAGATVGHGLGVKPSMIILKYRSSAANWWVKHAALNEADQHLQLNSTAAVQTTSTDDPFNGSLGTSTTFKVGSTDAARYGNANGTTIIAYVFSQVTGYSSFGSYTGNGSADGPFVYTGFRPRWVMIKNASANSVPAYGSWKIIDTSRDSYNGGNPAALYANASYAEGKRGNGDNDTYTERLDLLSNGFKLGAAFSYDIETNESGVTYIYAAFAESPFQYARAR